MWLSTCRAACRAIRAEPKGPAACAALTVTFHAKKPAHLLEPGRERCGEVVVADIGLGETPSNTIENGPEVWLPRFPWPTAASHKHARGRLIVVSGEAWSTGAARLAARGALRIGAGLVTILSPPEALPSNAAHLEAVMLRPFETDLELEQAAADVDAAVIGPAAGVTDTTLLNVLALARTGRRWCWTPTPSPSSATIRRSCSRCWTATTCSPRIRASSSGCSPVCWPVRPSGSPRPGGRRNGQGP